MEIIADGKSIAFLAWSDMHERLDILLLEVRHLQQNIIYFLRKPELYQPLIDEQDYLFFEKKHEGGENFNKILKKEGYLIKLVEDAIRNYPYPHQSDYYINDKYNKIQSLVNNNWGEHGEWTLEQQQFYYSLLSLQRVKRKIFYDKLFLYKNSHRLIKRDFGDYKEYDNDLGKFYILRNGILVKIEEYIQILNDFQSQFTNSQDIGLLDHPRPSIDRRREQRLFTATMSNKCRDMYREVRCLWFETEDKTPNERMSDNFSPLVFHRWKHWFSSRFLSFQGISKNHGNDFHIIKTSYFMPERPELRTIVAHEVAHVFLNEQWDVYSPQKISLSSHPMASIMRMVEQCLQVFGYPRASFFSGGLSKEIMADLLAAATQGYSYLYAMFLELIGGMTENLFYVGPEDKLDLNILDDLHLTGNGVFVQSDIMRQWYVRLYLVSRWLDMILPNKELERQLSKTIRKHCNILNRYLDYIAVPEEKDAPYFEALVNRLVAILAESTAKDKIEKWWKDRKNTWTASHGEARWSTPTPLWPISFHAKKFLSNKWLPQAESIILKHMGNSGQANGHSRNADELFHYIEDPPWQISVLLAGRVKQEVDANVEPNKYDFFEISKLFHSLVRIGTQYALEFYAHQTESPIVKMEEVLSILEQEQDLRKLSVDLVGSKSDTKNNQNDLNKNRLLQEKRFEELSNSYTLLEIAEYFNKKYSPPHIHDEQIKTSYYRTLVVKLKQINCKLNFLKSQGNENIALIELIRNLSFWIDNFEIDENNNKHPLSKVIELFCAKNNSELEIPYLNSRVSHAGPNVQQYASLSSTDFIKERYDFPLLGRYDRFVAHKLGKIGTYELPIKKDRLETTTPFFIRWEYGLPVRLDTEKEFKPFPTLESDNPPVLAFISILLRRTSSRFNFIHWLHQKKLGKKKHWAQECYAFLSDGWEDVVLVLRGNPEDVGKVFALQNDIYQHPLVLRTEMNFSTTALDYILTDDGREKIRIRVMYRLKDDVRMDANMRFAEGFQKAVLNEDDIFPFWTKLTRTPGRMDFSLRLWGPPQTECCINHQSPPSDPSTGACPDCWCDNQQNEGTSRAKCGSSCATSTCYRKIEAFTQLKKDLKDGNAPPAGIIYNKLSKLVNDVKIDRIQTNLGWVEDIPTK